VTDPGNDAIFALRVRASERGLQQLVRTIDRYLQRRNEGDLETILAALEQEKHP
jgi:soluble cytochrome b562